MNKDRRNRVARMITALNRIVEGGIEDLVSDLEALKDEEREAYDNMPEGLQQSERGQNAEEAAGYLETAHDALSSLQDSLNEAIDALENANGL